MKKHSKRRNLVSDNLGRRVVKLSREAGMNPSEFLREAIEEFANSHKKRNGTKPRTTLSTRLRVLRAKIIQGGSTLLDADGIARELADRRGERNN